MHRSTYSEPELLKSFANGDQQAYKVFFELHYQALCYFANSIISSIDESQDIVQNSFFKLWQKRADFQTAVSIKAFLYIVTKNACLDQLRYHQHMDARKQEILYLAEQDSHFLESKIIEEELLQKILLEIEALPSKYGNIIKMIFIEELSYREIAIRLSVSEPTIRKQKERALRQLQTAVLKKYMITAISLSGLLLSLRGKH